MTANPQLGAPVSGISLFEGWTNPRVLATPNINVNGGWTDSVYVTPDGSRLFFAYTKLNFSKYFYSGGVIQEYTGPSRPGMVGDKFKIFAAHIATGAVSYHPSNPDNPNVHVASPGVNVARNMVVMALWDDADGPDSQLALSKLSGASWSEPALLPVNSPAEDDNPFPQGSPDYFGMYLESTRDGKPSIYQTVYQGGAFLPPGLTPGLSTPDSHDHQPSVSPSGAEMYWTSVRNGTYGIYVGDRAANGDISNSRPLALLTFEPPFIGKAVLIGEFTVAEFPTKYLGYFVAAICDGVDTDGLPNSAQLKICVMSKAK